MVVETLSPQPMEETKEDEETDFSKAKKALQMVDAGAGSKKEKSIRAAKVDPHLPASSTYTVLQYSFSRKEGKLLERKIRIYVFSVVVNVYVCRWLEISTAC